MIWSLTWHTQFPLLVLDHNRQDTVDSTRSEQHAIGWYKTKTGCGHWYQIMTVSDLQVPNINRRRSWYQIQTVSDLRVPN
jgi:dipeptidase